MIRIRKPIGVISLLARLRRGAALLGLITLLVWPVWTLTAWEQELTHQQPTATQARAIWRARDKRFAPLRAYLPPGAVVAYNSNWPLPVGGSWLHEAQFAGAPVIVTDWWYQDTPWVLADLVDDRQVAALMKKKHLTLEAHLGRGFALLRRPSKPASITTITTITTPITTPTTQPAVPHAEPSP